MNPPGPQSVPVYARLSMPLFVLEKKNVPKQFDTISITSWREARTAISIHINRDENSFVRRENIDKGAVGSGYLQR